MKKIILLKVMSLVLLVTLALTACSSHHDETVQTQSSTVPHHLQPQEIQKMKAYLVSQRGFKDEHLQVDEEKGLLIAEGCMLFEMEDFWKKYAPHYDPAGGHTARPPLQAQYQAPHLVGDSYQKILVRPMNPGGASGLDVPHEWLVATIRACDAWNQLNGRLRFTLNRYEPHDATIYVFYAHMNNYLPSTAAVASFPTADGRPGQSITINASHNGSPSPEERVIIMAHEIGHTIGFQHTDLGQTENVGIEECNQYTDNQSIMWSSYNGKTNPSIIFTSCDQQAYHRMYP